MLAFYQRVTIVDAMQAPPAYSSFVEAAVRDVCGEGCNGHTIDFELAMTVQQYISGKNGNAPLESADLFFIAPNHHWMMNIVAGTDKLTLSGLPQVVKLIQQAPILKDLGASVVGHNSVAYLVTELPHMVYDSVNKNIKSTDRNDSYAAQYLVPPRLDGPSGFEQFYIVLLKQSGMKASISRPKGWNRPSRTSPPLLQWKARSEDRQSIEVQSSHLNFYTYPYNDTVVEHGKFTSVFCIEQSGQNLCDHLSAKPKGFGNNLPHVAVS